ncbi:MAG: PadR family transcriptional regulator [Nitrososphaerales archaeon]
MSKGRSVVPRGFSRFYILSLLREKSMTGKEIIEETERRTKGAWKPSPGLVYPLLGRLLSEGLIEEVEKGYKITEKGLRKLEEYIEVREEFDKIFGAIIRLFTYGGFVTQDIIDRIIGLITMLREDILKLSKEQKEKYKNFLITELNRINKEEESS